MNNLHPIFAQALAPFAPPPLEPREWIVFIKDGSRVIKRFPAMGYYRTHVQAANECICALYPGSQCIVLTPEEAKERAS